MNKLNFVPPKAHSSVFFAAKPIGRKEQASLFGTLMELFIKFERNARKGRETMSRFFNYLHG